MTRIPRPATKAIPATEVAATPSRADTVAGKILVGVAIAAIVGVVTYAWGAVEQRRKDELAFRNEQIEKLYGPLYATIKANSVVWTPFQDPENRAKLAPDGRQSPVWRRWMISVFQPQNKAMEKAILSNLQLTLPSVGSDESLGSGKLPASFLQLIEHTEAYRGVIAGWTPDDLPPDTPDTTWIRFPICLERCIEESYDLLRDRQAALQQQIFPHWRRPTLNSPDVCKIRDNPSESFEGPKELNRSTPEEECKPKLP